MTVMGVERLQKWATVSILIRKRDANLRPLQKLSLLTMTLYSLTLYTLIHS